MAKEEIGHGANWGPLARRVSAAIMAFPFPITRNSHFPWGASPCVSLFCQEKDKRRFFSVSLRRIPFSSKWIMLSLRRQINLSVISLVHCFQTNTLSVFLLPWSLVQMKANAHGRLEKLLPTAMEIPTGTTLPFWRGEVHKKTFMLWLITRIVWCRWGSFSDLLSS